MTARRIAFVGLGAMGHLMNKIQVRGSPEGGCADTVQVADSLGEVPRSCDVILTSLANDRAVKAVYAEFKQALTAESLDGHKVFVETSTCYPAFLEELETFINEVPNTQLIACQVFGAPPAADKAQLVIVMAGDQRVKGELTKLLVPAIGRKVIDVGGSIRKAPSLKLIGNSVIMGCLEVISEAITLGEKAGVDAHIVVGVLKDLFPNTPIASYGEMIANEAFDGNKNFAIDNGLKDAGHVRSLAAEHNSLMPAIDLAYQHMLTARALHLNQKAEGTQQFDVLGWSALVAGSRVAAGLNGLSLAEDIKVEKEQWC